MNVAAHLTPPKLRSGEPEALAALCDRRGAAVFAYCQAAAGRDAAVPAAAEAFAQFRRAILPAGALSDHSQAERLLRSATRRCALVYFEARSAGREADKGTDDCDGQEGAILVYVEDALAPAQREVVATHVMECGTCAAVLERLQDAEAAFKVKPGTPLPVPVARQILTALVQAAPVTVHGGDESAVRDEALRLLTADQADVDAAPAGPEPPDRGDDPKPIAEERGAAPFAEPPPGPPPVPAPPAPPPPPPVARPVAPQAPTGTRGNTPLRPRLRLPFFGRERFGTSRSAMLLRGAVKLVAVVVAAGAAGVLLGLAVAELTS